MQGELGTSHAYEFGGDYRPSPHYSQGVLAADFTWREAEGGYRIDNIVLGDPWNRRATSPLSMPGVDVRAGDILLAINGQRLSASLSPEQLLVNQADTGDSAHPGPAPARWGCGRRRTAVCTHAGGRRSSGG
jgi:tricorn protease